MDHDATLATYDRQMRREARPDGPGTRVERVGPVVRQTGPEHAWNGVLWSALDGLDGAGVDAVVAEQIRHYTASGSTFEWKAYGHDAPADLPERLRAAGFVPDEEEAVMVAEATRLSADVVLPDGVELVSVTDEAGVRLVTEVHDRAFGGDSSHIGRQLLDRLAAEPDTVAAVVATAGGEPVSAARLELIPGTDFAGLWGGGTVEAWRGRGLYRALVAHRTRIAAARGYRFVHVDAAPMSRPILRRLGFTALTTTTPYVYGASHAGR
ncbi:GNAT family N-acetyltransferase [Streptomyces solicathayae]|uniref:GNAT family N-acetyltransferase n=1 Tax=Streptomyces solicathayae TaxID=3081768 RepID=A0ABZ0M360_9ACTN|nr:GNAT family N-acetyltransferase [Streptomyces sp. HUAS YS2]WOX26212.1 GNAT family N-acetyltransferase [Streptomyces sp. HUAS YS2]